jgi:hypothetical protein
LEELGYDAANGFHSEPLGPTQLLLVLVIILVLFAGKSCRIWRAPWAADWAISRRARRGEKLANEKVKEIVDDIKKDEPEKVEGPKA